MQQKGNKSACYAVITIAIRLRYDDATTHSTTTEVIEITIRRPRQDYDEKNGRVNFWLASYASLPITRQ